MKEESETETHTGRDRRTATSASSALGSLGAVLRRGRESCSRWWTARTVRFRKITRTLVLLTAVSLVSLGVGAATATASSPVGPHEAQWSTTLDSTLSLDMGPLGQVSLDSPAGILGVRVELEEVPGEADPAAVSESALGEALSSDGAAYLSLVTHPELTIERGLRALVDDALRRAGLLESIMLCLVAAGRLATRGRLRDAVRAGLSRPAASSLLTATAAVTVVALLVPSLRSEPVTGNRLEVLAGTPLERARVSGRIGDVVQAYGGRVSAFLDDNTAFYTAAQANLRAAWEASQTIDGTTDVTAAEGAVDTDRVARDAQDAASAEASSTATDSSSNAPTARSGGRQGSITAVMTTDLHCNLDVIAFSGLLDALAGATVHMDDGDLTMTGSDPEQICVDALDDAVPDGVARVATIGNHDSASTAERLRTIGWTVTDGTVENVGGLRVLGDVDPERGEENATDIGMRLAGASCDAARKGNEADVVLIHRPDTFGPLVDDGCAPLLVAGHVHEERGMSTTRGGNLDVAQLISGAGKGGTSLGRVTQDAYMHVLSFDSEGGLLAWRTVTLHPDASVTVGAWEPVPEAG